MAFEDRRHAQLPPTEGEAVFNSARTRSERRGWDPSDAASFVGASHGRRVVSVADLLAAWRQSQGGFEGAGADAAMPPSAMPPGTSPTVGAPATGAGGVARDAGFHDAKLTVEQAAARMGVSPQFLRLGLQRKKFPFGAAINMGQGWSYYINARRFEMYMAGHDMALGTEQD